MSKEKIITLVLGFVIFILIAGSAGISMKGKKARQEDNKNKVAALENSDGNQFPVLDYAFSFDSTKVPENVADEISRCIPSYTDKEDLALELLIQWFDDQYPDAERQQYQSKDGIQLTKIIIAQNEDVIFDTYEDVPSSFEYHGKSHTLRCRQLDDFECYCE